MARSEEKLVYEGKIFKVYEWRQRMFDGSYETFERVERPDYVEIVAVMDGKIGVGMEEQPGLPEFCSLFAGRMEKGERPVEAAKRELLEESGMVAKRWKLLKKFNHGHKINFSGYLYAAIDCEKVAGQKLDPGERIKVSFVTLDKLVRIIRNMRASADVKLYFTELAYEKKKRRKFEKELGIK